MKIKTKTTIEPKNTQIFVADDGTEFDDEFLCRRYEYHLRLNKLENSPYVIENSEAAGYRPFNGGDHYSDQYYYRWFKAITPEGIDLLNSVFGFGAGDQRYPESIPQTKIGEWICVEYDDYYIDEGSGWYTLPNCIAYANEVLSALGEKGVTEYV